MGRRRGAGEEPERFPRSRLPEKRFAGMGKCSYLCSWKYILTTNHKIMKSLVKTHFLRCFILLALLLFGVPLQAQSIIYDGNQGGETSIIRNYIDGVDITHTLAVERCDRFNYVDRNSMITYYAEITDPIGVSDFVIFEGKVYFCGGYFEVGGAVKGVYGFFDINNVFFSGGNIDYWIVDAPMPYNPSNINYSEVAGFSKIDVMKTPYGETHILMTGSGTCFDSTIYYYGSNFYPAGLIADVRIDIYGTHTANYHVNKDFQYIFDDVAITDTHAIVTAHPAPNSNMCTYHIFYYKEPTSSGDDYFSGCISPGNPYPNVPMIFESPALSYPCPDKVLVAKMTHDEFAILCCRQGRQTLTIYNTPLVSPSYKGLLPDGNCSSEIVYNPVQKTLYMVRWRNDVLGIKYPFTTTTTISTSFDDYIWLSVDNADKDKHEILSGRSYYLQNKLWRLDDLNPNECVNYSNQANDNVEIQEYIQRITQIIERARLTEMVFIPGVKSHKYS